MRKCGKAQTLSTQTGAAGLSLSGVTLELEEKCKDTEIARDSRDSQAIIGPLAFARLCEEGVNFSKPNDPPCTLLIPSHTAQEVVSLQVTLTVPASPRTFYVQCKGFWEWEWAPWCMVRNDSRNSGRHSQSALGRLQPSFPLTFSSLLVFGLPQVLEVFIRHCLVWTKVLLRGSQN